MNNTMKLATLGLLAASSAFSTPALAEVKPYIGFEAGRLQADYKTSDGVDYSQVFDDSFTTLNPLVGLEVNDYLAVEAGYMQSTSSSKDLGTVTVAGVGTVSGETDLKVKGFHLDVLGKYPVTERFKLIGSVGVARLKADASLDVTGAAAGSVNDSETDTVARLGVGASYGMGEHFDMRTMLRYMPVDFGGTADNLMQVSFGATYKF